MRRPTVPPLTASNGHTTAIDQIARPVAGQVYDDDHGWVEVALDTIDGHVVSEHVEFIAELPALTGWIPTPPQMMPGLPMVPVDLNIGTPVFDQLNADVQHPRTPKGRISKKPPRLPWFGGLAYNVYLQGSRDDHHVYTGLWR